MGGRGLGPRGYLSEEEKKNAPKVSKELIFRILKYLKPYLPQLFVVFAIIILSSILGLMPSLITARIIDEAILGKDFALLIQLILLAILTLAASNIVGVLESYINSWVSHQIVYDMKNEMFAHLQTMPHSFFTSEKQGDIITRMNSDISGVATVISSILVNIISNLCTVITTLVALFRIDAKLSLIGIMVIPLLVLPTRNAGKNRWQLLAQSRAKDDELNDIINESLSVSGSLLIKLFTQEDQTNEKFRKINKEVTDLSIKESRAGSWFRVVMGIFTNLGPLLIYLAGGFLIIRMDDPDITVGTITATVSMINRLYRPVESLLNVSVDLTRSMALFTRIFSYLDMEAEVKNAKIVLQPSFEKTDISYEDVEFYYSADVPLIKDLSFNVPSGKMYAIVGPSGSGKSTVVNLLPRLYDVKGGAVKINGYDVRQIDLKITNKSAKRRKKYLLSFGKSYKISLSYGPNVRICVIHFIYYLKHG